jgi:RHS repeat-associated protein
MLPAAEERTPALTSGEETFSLAAGVALAALETHQGPHAAQGKKPHQGIFSKNRALRVGEIWVKYSGTHQDRKCSWWKTVVGSALDANGNTLTDAQGRSYTWDFENRLTQAVVPGTGTVAFKYDPFGRRIYKSSPSFTGIFVYDGDDLIETLGPGGTVVSHYTQGQKIDEPLAELRSGGSSYYEADGLGSVTSLSSSTDTLANTYTYDSFGNVTNSTGTLRNPFQYTGREFDQETGINYYRARYYDPASGRFLGEDPIWFLGGINFYPYVRNNPISRIDPLGLCPTPDNPEKSCGDQAPMPPTSQEPYPSSYFYRGVSANWMYQLGGNNPWGNRVRSCLLCMYSQGVPAEEAHAFCYSNASNRVSPWDTAEGYSAAYASAITFFFQNQSTPHGH